MPNFQKGKIYKLWSPQGAEEETYFGSTTDELHKRKSQHKSSHKRNKNICASNILFVKYDDVRIELVEDYPCDSKAELLKKEGEYIRNNKCLNKNIPDRTIKEYREDNIESIKDYQKAYYKDNKESIKDYQKAYHKDYLQEYTEKRSEQKKQYYRDNQERIRETVRKYQTSKQIYLGKN